MSSRTRGGGASVPLRLAVGVTALLLALVPGRTVAGSGLTLGLEPTEDGVQLVPAFGATSFREPSPEAAPAASDASDWRLHVIPAFWVPIRARGTVDVGPVRTEIDLNASELFSGLDFAIEGGLALTNDDWSFLLYGSYFKLGTDVRSSRGIGFEETSMEYKMTIVDAAVGKRLGGGPIGTGTWRSDLLGGLRYWDHKIDIDQTDPIGFAPMITRGERWVDAFVGGRLVLDFDEHASLSLRGDVGGFSIGSSSELTWTLAAVLELRLDDAWTLVIGYRYVDVDWETGSGLRRFEFDYEIHGPVIGASLRF